MKYNANQQRYVSPLQERKFREPLKKIDFNDVKPKAPIYDGELASVYKATLHEKEIAAKYMKLDESNPPREVTVHENLLYHTHILTPIGVAYNSCPFYNSYICMPLAEYSLYDYLHEGNNQLLFDESTKWALQIAEGMQHLHEHHIVHRDLKSRNVLVFPEGVIKLCDFGCARSLENPAHQSKVTGTHRWAAPEIHMSAHAVINKACDVFSYGMVLYELFMHQIPFDHIESDQEVTSLILKEKRPRISPVLPPYLQHLLQACWEHDSQHRPAFKMIVSGLKTRKFAHEMKTQQIPEPPHAPKEKPSLEPPDEGAQVHLVGYFQIPIEHLNIQGQFPNYQ